MANSSLSTNKSQSSHPFRVAYLLLDRFPILSLSASMDALRMANGHVKRELYHWDLVTADGSDAQSSSGATIKINTRLSADLAVDLLLVVAGIGIEDHRDRSVYERLCGLSRHGVMLGGLTLGTYPLARARLLDGYRCTAHWEFIESMRETFPHLNLIPDVFTIDRDRLTSSGGIASLDLTLALIGMQHGEQLAAVVSDLCIHERMRPNSDHQRMPLRTRIGSSHPKLLHAIEVMESDPESPFSRDILATRVGLSGRQLERLFRKYLTMTPRQYHMEYRLIRAQRMLRQTPMPVIDIALACGFSTASHFAKSYKEYFGTQPSQDR